MAPNVITEKRWRSTVFSLTLAIHFYPAHFHGLKNFVKFLLLFSQAVNNPEKAARRKIKQHENKKMAKKRKAAEQRPGKMVKRKKTTLADMAVLRDWAWLLVVCVCMSWWEM